MKCFSCKVEVNSKFKFALTQNKCPACGDSIFSEQGLADYNFLKTLIEPLVNVNSLEKIIGVITDNFELTKKAIKVKSNDEQVELIDDVIVDEDEEYKINQMREARVIGDKLKKLREDAFNDALIDEFGLGNANGALTREEVAKIANEQKQQEALSKVVSGGDGVFRR